MSGSYCGVRIGFYLLMLLSALLFLVTQVMAAKNPSPGLKLEDCNWFGQPNQKAREAAPQTLDGYIEDTSSHGGLGGGGAPTDQPSRDDERVSEIAVASEECPARNSS